MRLRTPFWLVARQEFTLSVRSRWMQTFAVVFALFALAVSASGYVLSGGSGLQDFARTAASLLQIVLLLVPLTTLVFGVMTLTPEAGAAELLFSQPIGRSAILAGKLCGLILALLGAQTIGFGLAGITLFLRTSSEGAPSFVTVWLAAASLTGVFAAIAAAIAAGHTSTRRARSLSVALVVWFVAVVLFDIGALGVASLLPSGTASRTLMVATIVNPVDAVRTGTLLAIEGTTAFGAGSVAFLRFTGGAIGAAAWLVLSLAAWAIAPWFVAAVRLRRADL